MIVLEVVMKIKLTIQSVIKLSIVFSDWIIPSKIKYQRSVYSMSRTKGLVRKHGANSEPCRRATRSLLQTRGMPTW